MQNRLSQGFAEIVLIVADVRKAAALYRDVVGLVPHEEDAEEADWAWFWAGEPGKTQRLALHHGLLLFEEHSPLPPGQRFGQVHFAFVVERADMEKATGKVRAAGIEVYGPVHHGWMQCLSYYFYDLDGNLLK